MCAAVKKIFNPQARDSDNRFNATDGYIYDASGNTTRDAQNKKFTYDGENKQTKVETVDANGNPTTTLGEYFYDGDGKRVKKVVPGTGETTVFIYDASGKLVAENSTLPSPTQTVSYLTSDHLGSPRINTDAKGNVTARHDYQPFGEEITRASYGADTNRKQFTGYERDKETDLDYAQARYFDSGFGRFSSPDDFLHDTDVSDTQSWNLYVYVRNNPLRFIDPTGKLKKKNGKVVTEAREDDDKNENLRMIEKDGKKVYYLTMSVYDAKGTAYVISWRVNKVFVTTDNNTKVKAYEAIGSIAVNRLDKSGNVEASFNSKILSDENLFPKNSENAPFSNTANCHGNTFADGQVWIDNNDVQGILDGDNYRPLEKGEKPEKDNVGMYRQKGENGMYNAHSVRVNSVDASGRVIDVISKGGIAAQRTQPAGFGHNTAWTNSTTSTVIKYWTQKPKR